MHANVYIHTIEGVYHRKTQINLIYSLVHHRKLSYLRSFFNSTTTSLPTKDLKNE